MQLHMFSTLLTLLALGSSIAAGADSDTYTNAETFKKACLDKHNSARKIHSAPSVSWDNSLAEYALQHAQKCVFEHSGGPHGENLAAGYSTSGEALQGWYDEESIYDYSSTEWQSAAGHFTQMVWKGTRKIGCAAVSCDGMLMSGVKSWYLVCEYSKTRGNILGQFQDNVLPPSGN